MSIEKASKILKMLLGYLKGEIEPPSPKTIEEAEKFEQEGYECLNMAIRSLEADSNIVDMLFGIRNEITMLHIFSREEVVKIIDKHLKEVENEK